MSRIILYSLFSILILLGSKKSHCLTIDNDDTDFVAPIPPTKEERIRFVKEISAIDYTPSLLTRSDREQELFFIPLKEFRNNTLFKDDRVYLKIARAVESEDLFSLLQMLRKGESAGATLDVLHAAILLLNPKESSPAKKREVNTIRQDLEFLLSNKEANITSAFASIALSSHYLKQQDFRNSLDAILRGATLIPSFQNISNHEATLLSLATNYQMAAFYYALMDMRSASDVYQRIIYEGSAYISPRHQAAHTRRLIDALYFQELFEEAIPHAERLVNQHYDDATLKAKAMYLYGMLIQSTKGQDAASGYFHDILKQKDLLPAGDVFAACRALYETTPTPELFDCLKEQIPDVFDAEPKHYWHKLNYTTLVNQDDFDGAIVHIKGMLDAAKIYMKDAVSRQSQRLILEHNVDMAKKQAVELKSELKLKKKLLSQSDRNDTLYKIMIVIIIVAGVLAVTFFFREKKNSRRMKKAAMTDTLTSLPNRRAILDEAEKCAKSCSDLKPWVIAVLDIDHFKKINDTYGHDGGDAALVLFSDVCKKWVPRNAKLGRHGGEEFLLVMPDAKIDDAKIFFARLQKSLQEQTMVVGETLHEITITLSVGAVEVEANKSVPSDELVESVIKMADDNVYEAKRAGRDQIVSSNAQFEESAS